MHNYKDNDYALNKYSDGIVYGFSDKKVEVTLDDYLSENPDKSADDFRVLKEFSDGDYLAQDRNDYRQTWKNSATNAVFDTDNRCEPSPEDLLISKLDKEETQTKRKATAQKIWSKLTEVQRRRYWMYHVEGLSTWKIAKLEGVNQSKIMKSLNAAEKKIKKFLSEN